MIRIPAMSITDNAINRFEELAAKSCSCYETILATYSRLSTNMAKLTAKQLHTYQQELDFLIKETSLLDAEIADYATSFASLPPTTKSVLQKRSDLIFAVHAKNREIARNATNLQSHIRHEIENSSKKRTAIKGYKPSVRDQKCIIKTSY